MQMDDLNAVTDRINSGAEITTVEPSLIEELWKAMSSIPKEQLQSTEGGLHAVAHGDPDRIPQNAEQRVAMMMRYALLDALVERGVLDEYMQDESLRKKLFATAALFPCDKNDVGEAVALRLARGSSPELAQKITEELKQEGYDPDRPKVGGRFIAWMHDNC